MKIDIITNDGSPLGVTLDTVYGRDNYQIGVGGAELALITMCQTWQKRGYDITLYNNPRKKDGSPFKQRFLHQFKPKDKRDILIVFRSPNKLIKKANGLKVWWSCDQQTVGDFKGFSKKVDKIVTISSFHAKHFKDTYDIEDTITIDLPVRLWEYEDKEIERIPYRFIFSSIPDRGLFHLAQIWDMLQERISEEAQLIITSDYRLWGVGAPMNEDYKMMFIKKPGVQFIGAVKRERLIEEQLKADLHVYPNIYDELFCISVAESQVAGAYPITSDVGALETTNMGKILEGHPKDHDWMENCTNLILEMLEDRESLQKNREEIITKAKFRFDPERIADAWDKKVFS